MGEELTFSLTFTFVGLKELIISYEPSTRMEDLSDENPLVSMVSVWYALELMPGLRTKFFCSQRNLSGN